MKLVLVPVIVNHQLINSFNPSPTTHVSPLNCHIAWPSFPTHYNFTPFPFHDLVHAREIVVQHVHFLQILGVKRAPERCAPSNSFNLSVAMTPGRDRAITVSFLVHPGKYPFLDTRYFLLSLTRPHSRPQEPFDSFGHVVDRTSTTF